MSQDQPELPALPITVPSNVASNVASNAQGPSPDRQTLLGEIERDVRERRRSGAITSEFEADLDVAWAEVSPPGSTGGGFESVADQAARHAIVDYDVPIVGSRPLRLLKRAVKLLTAWYMIFVGRQLVAFAGTSLRAMRILAGRVDALEGTTPSTDPRVRAVSVPVEFEVDLRVWFGAVIDQVRDLTPGGRVVHLDCGDGAMVVALHDANIDVYGVDPRADAGVAADDRNVEVRRDTALGHLRGLQPGSLLAVVLSGCVDRLALGDQLEVVSAAVSATHPTGVVVLLGHNPTAYVAELNPLAQDLAVGRPLHAETWMHIFRRAGMTDVEVRFDDARIPNEIVASADPAVRELAKRIFVPQTYCVIARRE